MFYFFYNFYCKDLFFINSLFITEPFLYCSVKAYIFNFQLKLYVRGNYHFLGLVNRDV